MITLRGGVLERRSNVSWFQIRVVLQDFLSARAGGQKLEDIFDANAQAAEARTPSALFGINRDSVQLAHCPS